MTKFVSPAAACIQAGLLFWEALPGGEADVEWEIGVGSERDRQSGVTAIDAACYFGGGRSWGMCKFYWYCLIF